VDADFRLFEVVHSVLVDSGLLGWMTARTVLVSFAIKIPGWVVQYRTVFRIRSPGFTAHSQ